MKLSMRLKAIAILGLSLALTPGLVLATNVYFSPMAETRCPSWSMVKDTIFLNLETTSRVEGPKDVRWEMAVFADIEADTETYCDENEGRCQEFREDTNRQLDRITEVGVHWHNRRYCTYRLSVGQPSQLWRALTLTTDRESLRLLEPLF